MLGFKIDEFSIGFGPHIFKHKNKKTGEVFAVRWIPLGGYCAFYGEEDAEDKDNAKKKKKGKKDKEEPVFEELAESEDEANVALDATNDASDNATTSALDATASASISDTASVPIMGDNATISEDIPSNAVGEAMAINDSKAVSTEGDSSATKPLSFVEQKCWKRIIVFIAGAFFNYLSAIILIAIYFMAFGDYTMKVTDTYDFTNGTEQRFEVGDELLRINGDKLYVLPYPDGPNRVITMLTSGDGEKVVTVRRRGRIVDIRVNKGDYITYDEAGVAKSNTGYGISFVEKDAKGNYYYDLGKYKSGFFEAIGRAFIFSYDTFLLIFKLLGQVFTGALGIKGNLGGPAMAIGQIAMLGREGFEYILYAIGMLSVNLAIMNLMPLPALDGSKVVFTTIEWVRGKPINRKVENIIHVVGLFVLFGMTIIFDILNFIP